LSKNPSADVRVYAVWFNMLYGDSRDRWDAGGMTDARVQHFWDEHKVIGDWFSSDVLHQDGTTWDFYAVYGPDATWGAEPPKALSQGGTIISRRSQLQSAITPVLRQGP
jgi:hypothetical protein